MKPPNRIAKPILDHGKYTVDVTSDGRSGKCEQKWFGLPLPPAVTRHRGGAIVILSDDGLAHEAFNGFAKHENAEQRLPSLVPVPTDSGDLIQYLQH